MMHFLTMDLLALATWLRKLNCTERTIIALLRSMDSDNPKVRRKMLGQYKQFSTFYINQQLHLHLSARTYSRAFLHLDQLGIIKRFRWLDKTTGKMRRYVKLSSRYWRAENRALDNPEGVLRNLERQYTATIGRTPRPPLADDQKNMIKEGAASATPLLSPESADVGGIAALFVGAAPPEQQGKKVKRTCPYCSGDATNAVHYNYVDCDHCHRKWPGDLRAADYFEALAGGK